MKNAETPVMKVVLFGALISFGSALMAELLRRQHEVIAILDDLNALAPRPGLRTKAGNFFSADRVCESIAGCTAVICLLDAKVFPVGPEHDRTPKNPTPEEQLIAAQTVLTCLMRMQIKRLILVADIQLLHDQPLADHQDPNIDKFQACALVVDSLRRSNADWTLVSAPQGVAGLSIEHFSQTGGTVEPGLQIPLEVLGRVAAGIADELRLNAHVRQ